MDEAAFVKLENSGRGTDFHECSFILSRLPLKRLLTLTTSLVGLQVLTVVQTIVMLTQCRDGSLCSVCLHLLSSPSNVGAFFEEGMWLRYNFQAPGVGSKESGSRSEGSPDPQGSPPDLTHEEIRFSFSTTKAPCILLYVSSLTTDFLAVLVKPTGGLQVRYSLGGTREPFSIDADTRNMANGQPHSVNITRHGKTIVLKLDHYPSVSYHLPSSSDTLFNSPKSLFLGKVIETGKIDQEIHKYNTPGFTGCLSRVQFNQLAPLKAALRQTNASAHVHIQGELVESNCGASPLTLSPMSSATDPWHLDHLDSDEKSISKARAQLGIDKRLEVHAELKFKSTLGLLIPRWPLRQTTRRSGSRVASDLSLPCGSADTVPSRSYPSSDKTSLHAELLKPNKCSQKPLASADFPYNPGQGQAIRNGVNRNSAIIGGVIAVVIFTILCTLVFLIRYMFRHKGTYHTNEAKGAESAESADAAIMNNDPNFTETIDESKKEWLI
ncbi:Contactin-associated protein-like 2 [Pteropus alecto]|uniref:Contactin-associated protein-like 2 n=1 Tax=Pteropus alecto TaxID=9402 RepID=L5K3Z8_PTEAL|nr:Contactin-associated protein-like 2 [Pteropus alecto]